MFALDTRITQFGGGKVQMSMICIAVFGPNRVITLGFSKLARGCGDHPEEMLIFPCEFFLQQRVTSRVPLEYFVNSFVLNAKKNMYTRIGVTLIHLQAGVCKFLLKLCNITKLIKST